MQRELFIKRLIRTLYLIGCLTFYVLLFVFIDSDLLASISLSLSLLFLVIFALSFLPNKKQKYKLNEKIKKYIVKNPLSLEEIKKQYRYHGLNNNINIVKLFYDESGEKRCVIYKHSNGFKITFEELIYHDDDLKFYTFSFANWEPHEITSSGLYETIELAINNNKNFLEGYSEDNKLIEKHQKLLVEIYWKGITIDSELLPFGRTYSFDIKIKDTLIKNIELNNLDWYSEKSCLSWLFIKENQKINIDKNFKFFIYNNNELIGVCYYFKNKKY